jgi:hypothetical protein
MGDRPVSAGSGCAERRWTHWDRRAHRHAPRRTDARP